MTVAMLFAGQGVDLVAQAHEWRVASWRVRALLELAAEHTGMPVAAMLHGSGAALRDTAVYQPVMTALSVGVLQELQEGLIPSVAAGHSLGELAAAVAVGAIDADDAVALAALRGRLMAREAAGHPGGMVAITAHTDYEALDAVAAACLHGHAQIAAHNAPDEWVLTGDHAAISRVPARHAPRMLPTSGPWHSFAMRGAVAGYRRALARVIRPSKLDLISNRHGRIVGPDEDLPELLAGQLTRPVQWHAAMETLRNASPDIIVTVGPAKPVASLARRTLGPATRIHRAETPRDMDRLMRAAVA